MSSNTTTMTRRTFTSTAGAAAAAALTTGIANYQAHADEAPQLDESSPIPPVAVPDSWDEEADVIVAGTGGGLCAALRAAELGGRVICLDPSYTWGGTSIETDIFAVFGSKYQERLWEVVDLAEFGMPGVTLADMFDQSMGGHSAEFFKEVFYQRYYAQAGGNLDMASGQTGDGTINPMGSPSRGSASHVRALLECEADMTDWLAEKIAPYGVTLAPVTMYGTSGIMFLCPAGSETGGFVARANYTIYEALYNACVDSGVKFELGNGVAALVADGQGAVVGVKTDEGTFIKANRGVILATGGMAGNQQMLAKYCPSIFYGAFTSTATPFDTGLGIRMGQGVGGIIILP